MDNNSKSKLPEDCNRKEEEKRELSKTEKQENKHEGSSSVFERLGISKNDIDKLDDFYKRTKRE